MAIRFYSKTPGYAWMSNFSSHPFTLDGMRWPTVEHYYQARKYPGRPAAEAIRRSGSPGEARKRGQDRSLTPREDWEAVKVEVMRRAIEAKFVQNRELGEKLIATGDEELIHESGTDHFWGQTKDGVGENRLGQILMGVRRALCGAE